MHSGEALGGGGPETMRVLIVSGLSGAGKSTVLRALEDLDYFCVDNLPLPLLDEFLKLGRFGKVALVVDARAGKFLEGWRENIGRLRSAGLPVEVLFLDAADETLIRRFSETRRRHPLAGDDLRAGILRERAVLAQLREDADAIVDTGNLNVHQLKGIIQERYGKTTSSLSVTLLSFGFKHGLPAEADMVFDVRFLPNPYFVEALSAKNGLDEEVSRFVLETEDARELLAHTQSFLGFTLPRFEREGKAYLTIAVGCTGGRHRSVAMAEELGRRLGAWKPTIRHRDLDRPSGASTGLSMGGP